MFWLRDCETNSAHLSVDELAFSQILKYCFTYDRFDIC